MTAATATQTRGADFRRASAIWIPGCVALVVGALGLQTLLPTLLPTASVLNLPLLVVVYFVLRCRGVIPAMLVGLVLGWAHDGLTQEPVGSYGLAYTVVAYLVGRASQIFKIHLYYVLGAFVAAAYLLHEVMLYAVRAQLIGQQYVPEPGLWCALATLHAGLALLAYPIFDKLAGRK